MSHRIRTLIAGIAVFGLVASTGGPALAIESRALAIESRERDAPEVMVDVFVLRPFSLILTAVSAGVVFPVAAFFTAITRPTEIGKPFKILVADPARFTFARPLGEW